MLIVDAVQFSAGWLEKLGEVIYHRSFEKLGEFNDGLIIVKAPRAKAVASGKTA